MKNLIFPSLVIFLIAGMGLAQDAYIIKDGDILSRIVEEQFPEERIYGPKGKLHEVKGLNPQLENLDTLLPNQKIILPPRQQDIPTPKLNEKKKNIVTESKKPRNKEEKKVIEIKKNISAAYGMRYVSVSQTGALGKPDTAVIIFNNLRLNSEFNFNDWSIGFQFESYKIPPLLDAKNSEQMYALNLYGSYRWILFGIDTEQNPLFRNNLGKFDMTKMTTVSLSVGARKDFNLPAEKPTMLILKGWLSRPISVSSSDADVKLNSVTGYGILGELDLTREIFSKDKYLLYATWMNQIGLQKIIQEVKWNTSVGESKSNILNASTSLGVLLKF